MALCCVFYTLNRHWHDIHKKRGERERDGLYRGSERCTRPARRTWGQCSFARGFSAGRKCSCSKCPSSQNGPSRRSRLSRLWKKTPEVAQSLASVEKWSREGQVDLDGQLALFIQHAGLKDLRKDAIQPIQYPSSGSRYSMVTPSCQLAKSRARFTATRPACTAKAPGFWWSKRPCRYGRLNGRVSRPKWRASNDTWGPSGRLSKTEEANWSCTLFSTSWGGGGGLYGTWRRDAVAQQSVNLLNWGSIDYIDIRSPWRSAAQSI